MTLFLFTLAPSFVRSVTIPFFFLLTLFKSLLKSFEPVPSLSIAFDLIIHQDTQRHDKHPTDRDGGIVPDSLDQRPQTTAR